MKTKEAIERVKTRFNKWALDEEDLTALQALGLVTIESEDERIRNALLRCCDDWEKGQFGCMAKEDVPAIRAYLEKQKAKERLDRMAPIYNDKESFESALEKAWKYYNESASRTVDSFEDDYIECVFSKGFREGFLYKKKQKEQESAENISQLTVQGKGVYKICPRCKERMVRDDSKVYTSMPPQYGYECPKCGEIEFDTVMYDNPEKPAEIEFDTVMYDNPEKPAESSEDERIRKEIINFLHSSFVTKNITDEKIAPWIAYLEKQKEQKDYKKLYENIAKSEWFKKAYEGKSLGCDYEQKEQKESVTTEWPNLSNCLKNCKKCMAKCFYRKEAYEEKKPTDLWNKEDEEMIQDIIDLLDPNIAATDFHEIEKWLKSLPERFNLPR